MRGGVCSAGDDHDWQEPHHDLRPERRRHIRGRVQDRQGRVARDLGAEDRGGRDRALPGADAVRSVRAECRAGTTI